MMFSNNFQVLIKWVRVSILISTLVLSISTFSVYAKESYVPNGPIEYDDERMVWMSIVDNKREIIVSESVSGERMITDQESDKRNPAIHGNYIVWQDDRNDPDPTIRQYDIYLFNLQTNQEVKISQTSGSHEEPKIHNNMVVWRNNAGSESNVVVYDISTGIQKHVTSGIQAFGIEIQGDQVVWMQYNSPYFDIYTYDLKTEDTSQLTHGNGHHKDPRVYDNQVVWHDYREGSREIFMYDIQSGTEKIVTQGEGDKTIKGFVEGQLLYADEGIGKIILQNIEDAQENELNIDFQSRNIIFQGEKITIFSDGNYSSYSTNSLIDSSGSDKSELEQDNIFTSPDGIFVIQGFNENSPSIAIKQVKVEGNENMVTKEIIYEVVKQEDLNEKVTIRLEYMNELDRRYSIYGLKEKQWVYLGGGHSNYVREVEVDLNDMNKFVMAYPKIQFTDTKDHWALEEIHFLYSRQIINGYNNDQFNPNKSVTRAEFVRMVIKALDLRLENEENGAIKYKDVPETHWASHDIEIATALGIIKGNGHNFNPSNQITREEIVTILARAASYSNGETNWEDTGVLNYYKDKDELQEWSIDAFSYAIQNGLVVGKSVHLLDPASQATRAEAATFTVRLMNLIKGVQ